MSSDGQSTAVHIGQASLTGLRGTAARAIAKPVARRTRFSQEQVEAFFGWVLLAFGLYLLLRPVVSAVKR
jgi:hypothetical protein